MTKKKVLLLTSYGPYELGFGEDMHDMFGSRLARGHGLFSLSSHCHYWGLHLIAENISHPTTVLEDPHWDEFLEELEEGYDVIGFQLKSIRTDKVAEMVRAIRARSPKSEIVMGGYGVSPLFDPVPNDPKGSAQYIVENSDHFCREEGVRFMRRLLNDEPVERPITQYHLPLGGFSIPGLNTPRHLRTPAILVSLGCPNACEFCNTSAFFYHKKIYVADPGEVYDFMKNYQRRLKSKNIMVILFDEDLFLKPKYVRELGRLIRSDRNTWGIRYFTFASMRSISQFEPEELRECGVGSAWIGVESSYREVVEDEHGYAKRAGKDMQDVFKGLHRYGIQTVASMILGFDFHTRENIKEDIDYFVSLKPTFYQIAPLTPCPGTPFYGRMVEEDRIYDDYGWKDYHIWKDDVFKIKNFERGELRNYFDLVHQKLVEENGPPLLQVLEGSLGAYETLKDSPSEFLRFQAEGSKKLAHGLQAFLRPIKTMGPCDKVKQRAGELEKKYRELVGKPPFLARQFSRLVNRRFERTAQNPPSKKVISDPPARWTYYNHGGGPTPLVRRGRRANKVVPYKDKLFFPGLSLA